MTQQEAREGEEGRMAKRPTTRWMPESGCLHVETELGIVNIYTGLHDARGRAVEAVSMRPDSFAGEPKVVVSKGRFVRLKTKVR